MRISTTRLNFSQTKNWDTDCLESSMCRAPRSGKAWPRELKVGWYTGRKPGQAAKGNNTLTYTEFVLFCYKEYWCLMEDR